MSATPRSGHSFSLTGKRIWVAGHRGMVGSALLRRLALEDGCEILTVDRDTVDLRRQSDVERWMAQHHPDIIILAAAKVGGILANSRYPADFLYDNLMIEANIIHMAARLDIEKLLFLGSSCIYPKHAPQPIAEDALLTGPLEPTNEAYAIAKIAGLKLCAAYRQQNGHDFISAMPTNLYGPNDNYDPETSHVVPALIHKIHAAKTSAAPSVTLWGTGQPRREFLHVDDMADGCLFLLKHYSGAEPVNLGYGEDIPIVELAEIIRTIVGFDGQVIFDSTKPDGTPRKLVDSSRLRSMGWSPKIEFRGGLASTYQVYLEQDGG